MDALILSCSTGGGHNAAGMALKEELEERGHFAAMLDPYSLVGNDLDNFVGNGYVRLVQKSPKLFGHIYQLGDWYRQLPIHSPVYEINRLMCRAMKQYLEEHHYDVILMPHIYPGEILTNLKKKGVSLPKTIFIATDYTCIPFTEEIECDYYVTPSTEVNEDFARWGIPPERLMPMGIPVRKEFYTQIGQREAKEQLGLEEEKRYLLLSGGSIGAGEMEKAMEKLREFLDANAEYRLIAVCGNNEKLYSNLCRTYKQDERIKILSHTGQMALYMKACDVYLSKPGGLSSTEAAVTGTPLVHLAPIPGCEMKNMEYFSSHGMSLEVGNDLENLCGALEKMKDPGYVEQLRQNQKIYIPCRAASDICELAEKMADSYYKGEAVWQS